VCALEDAATNQMNALVEKVNAHLPVVTVVPLAVIPWSVWHDTNAAFLMRLNFLPSSPWNSVLLAADARSSDFGPICEYRSKFPGEAGYGIAKQLLRRGDRAVPSSRQGGQCACHRGGRQAISAAMTDDLQTIISAVIARAPDWIRRDLLSRDNGNRVRAEEALGAMIANALKGAERS